MVPDDDRNVSEEFETEHDRPEDENEGEGGDPDLGAVEQAARQDEETTPEQSGIDSDPNDELAAARAAIRTAARHAEEDARGTLLSVDEGLVDLASTDEADTERETGSDRAADLERELEGLLGELTDEAKAYVRTAVDHLDSYRRQDPE